MESAQLKTQLHNVHLPAAAGVLDNLLMEAEEKGYTNQEFLYKLLSHELANRENKRLEKYLKQASFPEYKTLEEFDLSELFIY